MVYACKYISDHFSIFMIISLKNSCTADKILFVNVSDLVFVFSHYKCILIQGYLFLPLLMKISKEHYSIMGRHNSLVDNSKQLRNWHKPCMIAYF